MRGQHLFCLLCAALFAFSGGAEGAETGELIFEDGFDSGDLWGWNQMVGGSPNVGPCPCEYMFRGSTFDGKPLDAGYAETRMRNEPMARCMQQRVYE